MEASLEDITEAPDVSVGAMEPPREDNTEAHDASAGSVLSRHNARILPSPTRDCMLLLMPHYRCPRRRPQQATGTDQEDPRKIRRARGRIMS